MNERSCLFCRLGRIDYLRAWDLQKRLAGFVSAGGPDVLLLLEHPPTYTLGARGGEHNMLLSRTELERLGAEVHNVDRGGDVTFHGPGQLVGYPVCNLRRLETGIRDYLRSLEAVLIRTLSAFEIGASRIDGYTGVWVGEEKVAAIGVKITARRITQHGFALNVNTDLSYFDRIVPCGIRDKGVTTLGRILEEEVSMDRVSLIAAGAFGHVFEKEMTEIDAGELFGLPGIFREGSAA